MASGGLILVVDDEDPILTIVQMVLEDEGYEVVTAGHGAAALDLVRQRTPRLIILDLRMPVMDGWEFARAYRETPGPHAPIVILTAGRGREDRRGEVGAVAYISKPFEVTQLISVVSEHVT